MKKIAACAAAILLGSATHAPAAGPAEQHWSVVFPHHTAIPEKFGVPIRARFAASENIRPPDVPMPVPAPGRKTAPGPAEARE
jgi:hypothetical protein